MGDQVKSDKIPFPSRFGCALTFYTKDRTRPQGSAPPHQKCSAGSSSAVVRGLMLGLLKQMVLGAH